MIEQITATCADCDNPINGFKIRKGPARGMDSSYCEGCVNEYELAWSHEMNQEDAQSD